LPDFLYFGLALGALDRQLEVSRMLSIGILFLLTLFLKAGGAHNSMLARHDNHINKLDGALLEA